MDKIALHYKKLRRIADISGEVAIIIGVIGLVISICFTITFIFQRRVLLMFFPDMRLYTFPHEYGGFLLVLTVYLALAYTLKTEGHIRVELVTIHLSERIRAYLKSLNLALVLILVLVLMPQTITWMKNTMAADVRSLTTNTPMWIPYLSIPVGLCVFAFALAFALVDSFIEMKTQKRAREKDRRGR